MKLDDEQNGLARVDKTAASNVPVPSTQQRRSVPMKRTNERPSTEDLTPVPLTGTGMIRAELESVILPIFEQMANDEWNDASRVVSNLIPQAIATRSAQRENRIAANVRIIAGEVGQESLATFQGINDGNTAMLTGMVDSLLGELCPV